MTPEAIGSTDTGRVHQHNGTILVRAAECIGVDVSDKDINYFKVASRFVVYVDDIVDGYGLSPDVNELLEKPEEYFANYVNKAEMETVNEVLADLSDERREQWRKAEELPKHSVAKQNASSIHELKSALTDEAKLFRSLFLLEANGHDVSARQSFNDWLTHFSNGGYFLDAAVDLRSDYVANRVSIQPTIAHKAALSGWALSELQAALKITRSARFLVELGKTASATLLEARRS